MAVALTGFVRLLFVRLLLVKTLFTDAFFVAGLVEYAKAADSTGEEMKR